MKFLADSVPAITISREVEDNPQTPSIHVFEVEMRSGDWDLEDPSVCDEVFARARIVLFDPIQGSPTRDGDIQSQELFDVATAFYDPDGDLSVRAMAKFESSDGIAPPLAYVEEVKALEGFEEGGRIEAGLAMALRRIGLDYGCEFMDAPLMLAIHQQGALKLVSGVDLADESAPSRDASLPKQLRELFRLGAWVAEGEPYASEPGHGVAAGLALSPALDAMFGYGQSLEGDALLGSPGAPLDFEVEQRDRSDEAMDAWRSARQAAHAKAAAAKASPSLVGQLESARARVAACAKEDAIPDAEAAALRSIAERILAALPAPKLEVAGKVKAKRAARGASAAAPSNGPASTPELG